MSDRFFEAQEKHYETPENNIRAAALRLARHKMLVRIAKGHTYPSLDIEDLNEILMVAGLPVIMPDEVKAKEVDVIKVDKEVEHDNTDKHDII